MPKVYEQTQPHETSRWQKFNSFQDQTMAESENTPPEWMPNLASLPEWPE